MPRYSKYGNNDSVIAEEGDRGFFRMNQRLRPDQLQPGELVLSQNGRMGIDGAWQVRKGIDQFGPVVASGTDALTLPFYLYADTIPSSVTTGSNLITVNFAAPEVFYDGTIVNVSGITGVTPDPNGNRTITVTGGTDGAVTQFTYPLTGSSGTAAGTIVIGTGELIANTNKVYGSCIFSDAATANTEYILLVQNSSCIAVKVADATTTTITYPASTTITSAVDVKQFANKVYIFIDGSTALEWDGDIGGGLAFTLVANGNYTQPSVFTSSGNTAGTAGVVTVTETAHGLVVGKKVIINDAGTTPLTVGDSYTVATVPTANTFTFFANVDDFSSHSVVLGVSQSVGLGFTHMPCPPWAVYHQRRLWMPFNYVSSGSSGSPTITDRDVRDEIIASDIFDADTYDQIENQFKMASGSADYIVAMQPFADDNILVLCRNSIHIIAGISGSLEDTVVKEITREVGCVSRKSIAQIGNQIYFLSDNGVYSVDFGDLYNLRGSSVPLSEAIQPLIDRINSEYAKNSVGIYHDNRYWIFIPLDSSTLNNACFVYNMLNQGWESLDIIEVDGWDVDNVLRTSAGGINKLYTINSFGGIHIIDSRVDDVDNLLTQPGGAATSYNINSSMKTRLFTQGVMDKKRWNAFDIHMESTSTNTSDATLSFETENPDSTNTLDSVSALLDGVLPISEDAAVEGRIGNKRGYGGQFTITPTQGRPKVRMIKVTSQLTDKAISSKQ